MPAITENQFITMLEDMNRPTTFVTFWAVTEPNLLKTGNPFWNGTWIIRKHAKVNGIIGPSLSYRSCVERSRIRANGEDAVLPFTPQQRRWGQRREGTPVVDHNGHVYLEVRVNSPLHVEYRTLDNVIVPLEQVTLFEKERIPSNTQQVPLEFETIWRDYRTDHIVGMAVSFDRGEQGNLYEVHHGQ